MLFIVVVYIENDGEFGDILCSDDDEAASNDGV
jgi:hypothetical protein